MVTPVAWYRRKTSRCEECGRRLVDGVCPEVQRQRDDYDAQVELAIRTGDRGHLPIWDRP